MNISRLYHTLIHLKPQQWFYRAWYRLKKKIYRSPAGLTIPVSQAIASGQKSFYPLPAIHCYQSSDNTFSFLNISYTFGKEIDWEFSEYGMLWAYNLNYFNWLGDPSINIQDRFNTILAYTRAQHVIGAQPYPSSLRGIQWIKFLSANNIYNEQVLELLYQDYHRLAAFPEYHLMGNHLLENGFSLFYGAHFFNNKDFYELASKILSEQLREQVLPDGGHYELSPMYHCILLQRLLECVELAGLSDRFRNKNLYTLMVHAAENMLGWLKAFIYKDGSYAMVGDSAPRVALQPAELFAYSAYLQISAAPRQLAESGYRKFAHPGYQLLADAGNIMPRYQPGHAHADTFSFCLNVQGKPIIVDTGISTYEKNERRLAERGTEAHNTINIEGLNSSDVWDGFRVGKKAVVAIKEDSSSHLSATHNGYGDIGISHRRSFTCNPKEIIIEDTITGGKNRQIYSHIHFHPACNIEKTGLFSFKIDSIIINISGGTGATLVNYLYCSDYNKTEPAVRLRIHIEEHAVVRIEL